MKLSIESTRCFFHLVVLCVNQCRVTRKEAIGTRKSVSTSSLVKLCLLLYSVFFVKMVKQILCLSVCGLSYICVHWSRCYLSCCLCYFVLCVTLWGFFFSLPGTLRPVRSSVRSFSILVPPTAAKHTMPWRDFCRLRLASTVDHSNFWLQKSSTRATLLWVDTCVLGVLSLWVGVRGGGRCSFILAFFSFDSGSSLFF